MQFAEDLAQAVGNTPLIKLRRVSEETGCTILGKAEFLNPGQSVKDRAALYIVKDAVARGELRPGGTIVEGTAGNTGIGLALVQRSAERIGARVSASSRPGVGSCFRVEFGADLRLNDPDEVIDVERRLTYGINTRRVVLTEIDAAVYRVRKGEGEWDAAYLKGRLQEGLKAVRGAQLAVTEFQRKLQSEAPTNG